MSITIEQLAARLAVEAARRGISTERLAQTPEDEGLAMASPSALVTMSCAVVIRW